MLVFILLVIALALIAYVYAGYPLIMALWAGCVGGRKGGAFEPHITCCSVVIAVYNDAKPLLHKLRGMLESEGGWIGEVLVGSDGSSDDLAAAMEGLGDARVRLIPFAQRRGKTAVLNELVPQCRYDVVVLMDARQLVAPGAIRALLARFNDEEVGVVSGELVFRECEEERDEWGGIRGGSGTAEGMGAYWRYEKWIRKNEAVVGSVPGATGACYAMRRALFCRIPPQTILDDVAYPMQAVMQGYRCVFEEQAVVFDVPSCDTQQESVRKRRTLAGNVQLVQLFPGWLLPSRNPIAFQFVSHKILRLFVPFLAIYALIAAVFGVILAENVLFRGVFAVFLLFCAFFAVFCMMGAFFERCGRKGRLFSLFWMFFVLNWVTLLGVLDGLRGRYRVTWDKAY